MVGDLEAKERLCLLGTDGPRRRDLNNVEVFRFRTGQAQTLMRQDLTDLTCRKATRVK